MSKLTKLARGRECQVRLPCCNHNPETTVLAHFRLAGICGIGMKPHDILGAWACSTCHDEIDRRTRLFPVEIARLAHAEGVVRTINALIKDGNLKI